MSVLPSVAHTAMSNEMDGKLGHSIFDIYSYEYEEYDG